MRIMFSPFLRSQLTIIRLRETSLPSSNRSSSIGWIMLPLFPFDVSNHGVQLFPFRQRLKEIGEYSHKLSTSRDQSGYVMRMMPSFCLGHDHHGRALLCTLMPPSHQQLLFAAEVLFLDLSANPPSNILVAHFSSTKEVVIQHAPALCPHPYTSRLTGLNAVRSYFDLLTTHWMRSDTQTHSRTVVGPSQVAVNGSVQWTWRSSGRSWREDFLCTLDYDDNLKVVGMVVETHSAPGTCVMRAVDEDPLESGERRMAPAVRVFDLTFPVANLHSFQ